MHRGSRIGALYLCWTPVDLRKQIDGLACIVEQELTMNPFNDALFANRRRDKTVLTESFKAILTLNQQ